MVKIAFYKNKSHLFNKLVSWYTRGKYSHCEIIVGETQAGESVCYSSSFRDHGVRKKYIILDPNVWDVVTIDYDPKIAQDWFDQRIGYKYDVLGLVGFLFRRLDGEKRKYFCSEAVAESIGFSESWRFDPNTLKVTLDRISIERK